ncbi:MAG: TetR/AcrR family transcriptional regulator [Verrucomicrobia bacterium]|nr:TetR/AcrR family transcriptional regulator [Verrucomicrobiota bacterium]NBU08451.1 TetR/AcrR family transcriptional regulator [Pseudomonadota bacterium]NDA67980.1 TetR/AcrR family transcriptional regulator [Verrucomicrobiota bacterium]NDB76397.1 TetR/AcrR family transcriptional regulator [Verrucomicrobiota bacterium]NDD39753.1 TetR/AcrR family transcriptional regulator [Verrucomicrobiota bacterium]
MEPNVVNATRDKILAIALRLFADRGYAGTSIQDIVDGARVTKPALYYYFPSKAELYQALLNRAHDERFRLMQAASARGKDLSGKLEEILNAHFAFLKSHRELVGLVYATAFAARGEMPKEIRYLDKCQRNFDLIRDLIRSGQRAGELKRAFTAEHLARGIFGMMNIHVQAELVQPGQKPSRKTARQIVQLFLEGAAART